MGVDVEEAVELAGVAVGMAVIAMEGFSARTAMASPGIAETTMTAATTERTAMAIREVIASVMLLEEEAEASVVQMRGHLVERTAKTGLLKVAGAEAAAAVAVEVVTVAMEETMRVVEDAASMIVTADLAVAMR